MRNITAQSLLLSVAAAQPWKGSGSWAPGSSCSTAFPSGSSTVVIHGTQTVIVSPPVSGASWSTAGPWTSASPRISGGDGDIRSRPSGGSWPASPPFHGRNSNTFKIAILSSTNYYRYQHDAPFLAWNDSLVQNVANHADQCIWDLSHGVARENLAEGYPDAVGSIDAWAGERSRYSLQGDRPGYDGTTANFAQLVWKSTTSVGCAAVNCNGTNNVDGWYLVCKYWPPGNTGATSGNNDDDDDDDDDDNNNNNDNGTLDQQFSQNVQSQVNDGTGFNEADAVQGTDGQEASSTGSSTTTAQTGKNAAPALNDINQDGIVTGHKGQLGLVVFFAFACAFL